MLLAACGSPSASSSAGSGGAGGASSADTAACVSQAKSFLGSWQNLPTALPASPPARYTKLATPPPAGKKIAYLAQSFPADQNTAAAVGTAVQRLGWTSQTFVYDSTVPDLQAKFQTAIESKPDFIALAGFPAAAVQQQIDAAKAAGIGVILASVPDKPTGTTGLAAVTNSGDTSVLIGKINANMMLADSGCTGNVALFTLDYPILKILDDSFKAEVTRLCPTCKVTVTNIQAQDIGTPKATQQMVAQLQADPSTTYAYTEIGNLAGGLAQALKVAGLDNVKIFGEVPDEASYAALRNKTNAWWVDQNSTTTGYDMVDAAARVVVTGKPQLDVGGYPLALLTPQNVPGGTGIPTIPSNLLDLYAANWK
jgi:ABC-type sugar transport system substrate-binding protein